MNDYLNTAIKHAAVEARFMTVEIAAHSESEPNARLQTPLIHQTNLSENY